MTTLFSQEEVILPHLLPAPYPLSPGYGKNRRLGIPTLSFVFSGPASTFPELGAERQICQQEETGEEKKKLNESVGAKEIGLEGCVCGCAHMRVCTHVSVCTCVRLCECVCVCARARACVCRVACECV